MADRKPRKRKRPADPVPTPRTRQADDAERSLGRAVALGLPAVALVGAIVVGVIAGLGSAILVLASGALLGAIALLWSSVRTLSGDAPLTSGLEGATMGGRAVNDLLEEKRRVLRALKDIEAEHAIGKIDDADYGVIVERYREDAKRVMREIDLGVEPLRAEAERMAREYVEKQKNPPEGPSDPDLAAKADRSACASCGVSNEPDAAFCKKCGASMKMVGPAEPSNASS